MVGLAIFFAVVTFIAFAAGLVCLVGLLCSTGARDKKEWSVGVGVSFVCMLILGLLMYFSAQFGYSNNFYNLHEEYRAEKSNVDILEKKLGVLESKLLDLMESYINLDKELVETVKDRDTSEMRMLFERYPQLKAFGDVRDTMKDYMQLVDDVAFQERTVNAVARAYNSAQQTRPSRWFTPDNVPLSLELFKPK